MFTRLFLTMSVLCLAWPLGAQDAKRVAVLDFEYNTVRSGVAAWFGTDLDIGQGIRDLVVRKFVSDGSYRVIERAALEDVLIEQDFSNSDRANPATAAKLGQVLGVDAIIIGSITQFGRDDESVGVGGGAFGGRARKYGLGGVNQKKARAIVGITARIIHVDTAEVLAVATAKGESKRSGLGLAGSGGTWRTGAGGAVDLSSSNFANTIVGEAVYEAVEKLSNDLASSSHRIEERVIEISALVADYFDGQLVINAGATSGVQPGDRLSVRRVIREVKDPNTGDIIRVIDKEIGLMLVDDVDAGTAMGRFVGDETPEAGDRVTN